jgi:hypothetical protein
MLIGVISHSKMPDKECKDKVKDLASNTGNLNMKLLTIME